MGHSSQKLGMGTALHSLRELDRLQDVLSGQVIWSERLVAASSMQLNLSLSLWVAWLSVSQQVLTAFI